MVQKIIWTREAQININGIKDYISIDSEYYASKVINIIYSSAQKLLTFPEAGMVIYYTEQFNVRRILIKKYRLLYIIHNNRIYIIAVYHQSRELPVSFDFLDLL
jgi:plasmid stabilization system protein ParE